MKRKINTLKKRILAGVIAGMMVFTQGFPMAEQLGIIMENVYASATTIEGIEWLYVILDDGTLEIERGSTFGDKIEIVIPEKIDGMQVTQIGRFAFKGCSSLKSIEIPNGITKIGDSAFRGCSGLNSIELPDSVTNIEDSAFQNCSSLQSIEIPNSVTRISGFAFKGACLQNHKW